MDERREQRVQEAERRKPTPTPSTSACRRSCQDDAPAAAGDRSVSTKLSRSLPISTTSALSLRDVGARAHRHADVGLHQRRRVVDAVADHRHPRPAAPELADARDASRRAAARLPPPSTPSSRRDGRGGRRPRRRSAGWSADPSRAARHGLAGLGPQHVGDPDRARAGTAQGDQDLGPSRLDRKVAGIVDP